MIIKIIDGYLLFKCPHCKNLVQVFLEELNCKVFRHATLKANYQQLSPHMSKEFCDKYYNDKLIYGCGKPFEIIETEKGFSVRKCGYI